MSADRTDGANQTDTEGQADRDQESYGGPRRGPAGGLGDLFEKLMSDENPVKAQIDRNAKALAQSALSRLDVVPRAEFDAQSEVLKRTRAKVDALEKELDRLSKLLEG